MSMTTRGALPGAALTLPKMRGSGNRTIIIGDSIAAGNGSAGAWFENLVALSSGRIRMIRNSGVAGNTSTQMLARFTTDVIAYAPDWVVIEGVTPNDPGQTISVATSKANITAMAAAAIAARIRPIVVNGPPSDNTTYRDHMLNVNAWQSQWAGSQGIPCLDLYTPTADPADGTFLAANTTDGTHFTKAGATAAATWNVGLLPADLQYVPILSGGKNDPANLVTNGNFTTDTNADGIADSWTIGNGLATHSLTAMSATEGIGNWQNVTSAGGTEYLQQQLTSGWSVGDVLEFSARHQNAGTASTAVNMLINFGGLSVPTLWGSFNFVCPSSTVITGRMTVPVGATTMFLYLMANSAAGQVKWGQVTMRNLTTLGLA